MLAHPKFSHKLNFSVPSLIKALKKTLPLRFINLNKKFVEFMDSYSNFVYVTMN